MDEPNIGRTTFYDHFEPKGYLLQETCADLFTHIFSDRLSAENSYDFSFTAGKPHAMVTRILYHLLNNERNILNFLTSESGERFLSIFRMFGVSDLLRRNQQAAK